MDDNASRVCLRILRIENFAGEKREYFVASAKFLSSVVEGWIEVSGRHIFLGHNLSGRHQFRLADNHVSVGNRAMCLDVDESSYAIANICREVIGTRRLEDIGSSGG